MNSDKSFLMLFSIDLKFALAFYLIYLSLWEHFVKTNDKRFH